MLIQDVLHRAGGNVISQVFHGPGNTLVPPIRVAFRQTKCLFHNLRPRFFFESKDPKNPAKFYFNSCTAHTSYPCKKVTKADAVVAHMGSLEGSNDRNINKMLVNQVLPTCQIQMGMTELAPGSVWNTMPAHVHSRRMEAYFYFEVPEDHAVCHFMGEVDETRHIWMKGDQAVLSPEWSIHSAAATHNYTFIWGMGGENLDYGDQDFSLITDLK